MALLVAIFVSNLPEGIGSGIDMEGAGVRAKESSGCFSWSQSYAPSPLCSVSQSPIRSPEISRLGIEGFAAGALLVMLIDSMIPESKEKAGRHAGLVAVVGFAVATALSTL